MRRQQKIRTHEKFLIFSSSNCLYDCRKRKIRKMLQKFTTSNQTSYFSKHVEALLRKNTFCFGSNIVDLKEPRGQ